MLHERSEKNLLKICLNDVVAFQDEELKKKYQISDDPVNSTNFSPRSALLSGY